MYLSDQPWREFNGTWLKIEGFKRFFSDLSIYEVFLKNSWSVNVENLFLFHFQTLNYE